MDHPPCAWRPSDASSFLFDWDGIIADSKLDFSGIRERYFGGRHAMILEEAKLLDDETRARLERELVELEVEGGRRSRLVPGVDRVLEWVESHGIPWAVVSRNCRQSIVEAAKACGIELPALVRSRDDGTSVKPDPRALLETAHSLGADPRSSVFIGDLLYDMMGARRAAMRGIIVNKDIDPAWEPWIELSFKDMPSLLSALETGEAYMPWEYKMMIEDAAAGSIEETERLLAYASSIASPLPSDPSIDLFAWVIGAASCGLGALDVPDQPLSVDMWRASPGIPARLMGESLQVVIADILRDRFPLLKINSFDDKVYMTLPSERSEIVPYLLSSMRRSDR